MHDINLDVFKEANQAKISWSTRAKLIDEQFPFTAKMDWYQIFREDPTILGKILNDLIKLEGERTGKPGKRPTLDLDIAEVKLRQMRGEDYTEYVFKDSLRILAGKLSVRGIANRTGLDKSYVHRLLTGNAIPTVEVLETVAKAFKKKPSYFLEYRIGYILAVTYYNLENNPEVSINWYNKIAGRNERAK